MGRHKPGALRYLPFVGTENLGGNGELSFGYAECEVPLEPRGIKILSRYGDNWTDLEFLQVAALFSHIDSLLGKTCEF